MKLRELLPDAAIDPPDGAAAEIAALVYDNRQAGPGSLFFCVPGFTRDGHDFAEAAVAAGAAALVVERPLSLGVPEARVPSARAAMAPAAARFNGNPTAQLHVAGITGTNGKTTTAFLIRSLLEHAGRRCALLGTIKSVIGGQEREVTRTTAEAIDLQRDFRAMLDAGDECCAMEVSSHALELSRADGIAFRVAVFTNLTQDHLDFHPTMEAYFLAKRRLFEPDPGAVHSGPQIPPPARVINIDDPHGARLAGELGDAITFGIDSADAAYRATDLACGGSGCEFVLESGPPTARRRHDVTLPLPGRFNVANALGAAAAAESLGVGIDDIVAGLALAQPVPGRMQPVVPASGFTVLVDYAHTPDSLENVLLAARDITDGRVICVFGCGGDRDRGKRPLMGALASQLADVAIITSDNPRSEDPEAIINEIAAGIAHGHPAAVTRIADRRDAIVAGIAQARAGDIVLIAGKGHEQGQEFENGRKLPFDDVEVAGRALRETAAA